MSPMSTGRPSMSSRRSAGAARTGRDRAALEARGAVGAVRRRRPAASSPPPRRRSRGGRGAGRRRWPGDLTCQCSRSEPPAAATAAQYRGAWSNRRPPRGADLTASGDQRHREPEGRQGGEQQEAVEHGPDEPPAARGLQVPRLLLAARPRALPESVEHASRRPSPAAARSWSAGAGRTRSRRGHRTTRPR